MWSFVIKNRVRQLHTLVKHYWIFIVAICVGILFSRDMAFEGLRVLNNFNSVPQFIILISYFYIVLVRKYPLVIINPAYIIFSRANAAFKKLVMIKIALVTSELLLFVFVLKAIFANQLSWLCVLAYFVGFIVCCLLSWSRYNNQYSSSIYWIATIFLMACSFMPVVLLTIATLEIAILLIERPHANWNKLLFDLRVIYRAQSAFLRMDFADMQAIAQSYSIKNRYWLPYRAVFGKALLGKSICVDVLRVSKNAYLLILACYAVALILRIDCLAFDHLGIISLLLIVSSVASLSNEQAVHARTMSAKIAQGFYIPYGFARIALWNVLFASFMLTVMNCIAVLVEGIDFLPTLVVTTLCCLVMFLNSFCSLKWPRSELIIRIINILINAILISFWWILA